MYMFSSCNIKTFICRTDVRPPLARAGWNVAYELTTTSGQVTRVRIEPVQPMTRLGRFGLDTFRMATLKLSTVPGANWLSPGIGPPRTLWPIL